jgi:Domain of unknown function (DUF1707)
LRKSFVCGRRRVVLRHDVCRVTVLTVQQQGSPSPLPVGRATIQVDVLVGDPERELAASALRRHFVHGRLSTDEFAHRVDTALRARSRADLAVAMDGLPLVWEDLPASIHWAASRVRRGARRATFFFALVRVWFKVNLALILAFAVALAVGAPLGTTLGVVVAAWALASYGFWRVWRHEPSTPE